MHFCLGLASVQRVSSLARVISAQQGVGPTGCSAQGFVLDDGGVGEQVLLAALVLHAVVSAGPDALEVVDLALAVAGAAAGAVALVLGALGLGAQVADVRQRA